MDNTYLERALAVVQDKKILVNLAAKRAGELSRGARRLVECPRDTQPLDVALLEIAEGKVRANFPS